MKREATLVRLFRRRLGSARGSVLLEFACFASLFVYAFVYAADFTRTLFIEQQLDIASRALADIEAHLKPGARTNSVATIHRTYTQPSGVLGGGNYVNDTSGCPGQPGKKIVREYLAKVLNIDSSAVYCRGYFYRQNGPLHLVLNTAAEQSFALIAVPSGYSSNKIVSLIFKAFRKMEDFFTGREVRYFHEIVPTDKVVATSVSVQVQPSIKGHAYNLFGRHSEYGWMMFPSYENVYENGKQVEDRRKRHYYFMPSFDTAVLPPHTYIREAPAIFKAWLGGD